MPFRNLTKDFCYSIAKGCTGRNNLRKKDGAVYNKCRHNNWLEELFPKPVKTGNHPSKYGYKYQKLWKKNNLAKVAADDLKRRRSIKNATPSWLTRKDWDKMNYIYSLAKEQSSIVGEKYHVDHIIPIRGKNICGLHVPWNLQVLPSDLNLKKGNV